MKFELESILQEYEGVLSGYTALLIFRLMNLCVKAEPASLLAAEISVQGAVKNIEDVANVGIKAEDLLDVYPFSDDLIMPIGHAIMDIHPEFKQDVEVVHLEQQNKDLKFIRLTMPEVDEARHKVLIDGLDTFLDASKTQFDATKTKYTLRMEKELINAKPDEVDEAKNRFDTMYDDYSKRRDKAIEDKKNEIEESYQRWQEKIAEKEKEMQEKMAAAGDDVKSKMKLPVENR